MKQKYIVLVCCVFCAVVLPRVLFASVEITEIMYDLKDVPDTDHEWVEIKNTGSSAVDLTGYKFNDGSNHVLNAPPENGGQGTLSLPADGFAILAADAEKFLFDHAAYVGTVIDTAMSLNNAGDTLKVIDSTGETADSVMYASGQGASEDGKSLQKSGSNWLAADPTPGAATNASSSTTTITPTTTTTTTSTTSGVTGGATPQTAKVVEPKPYVPPSIGATVLLPEYATAGLPIKIQTKVTGYSGEPLSHGIFKWNTGDGIEIGSESNKEPISYTYQYPGEYVLVFSYYTNPYALEPEVTVRRLVSVVAPETIIKEVRPDGTVVLSNTSDYDVDLSRWTLGSAGKTFIMPKHTFILPGHDLALSGARTGFNAVIGPIPAVTLSYPNGEAVSVYPVPPPASAMTQVGTQSVFAVAPKAAAQHQAVPFPIAIEAGSVSTNKEASAFTASVIDAPRGENKKSDRTLLSTLMFTGVAAIAVGTGIYMVRYRRAKEALGMPSPADEYELIE